MKHILYLLLAFAIFLTGCTRPQLSTEAEETQVSVTVLPVTEKSEAEELEELKEYLSDRAVQLLWDLDSDFESAVEQIQFGAETGQHFVDTGVVLNEISLKQIFNENRNLKDVYAVKIGSIFEDRTFGVATYIMFDDFEKETPIGVVFTKEDEKWNINNLYTFIG